MYSKLKVLLLVNEFRTWHIARHLSYSAQLGIEDGLRASGAQCLTVTSQWLPGILDAFKGRRFDQVWVAGRLDVFDEASLDRLASLSPVRLGMLSESAEYTAEECRISPGLKYRKEIIDRRLPYLTHALACDEKDAADMNTRNVLPSIWWPQAVPERFITDKPAPPSEERAVFHGNRYALRFEYLRHPDLRQLLVHHSSPEMRTIYPLLFTGLHLPFVLPFRLALPFKERSLETYLARLRFIRQRCYEDWFRGLQTGRAVVNLPHFVKTYAGRVVEGMAAGRPVISWEIPDRPRNRELFEDEREILLFAKDDPDQLAGQIRRLLSDSDLSRRLVVDARKKLRRFHTLEIRVRQILDWVTGGTVPLYS